MYSPVWASPCPSVKWEKYFVRHPVLILRSDCCRSIGSISTKSRSQSGVGGWGA